MAKRARAKPHCPMTEFKYQTKVNASISSYACHPFAQVSHRSAPTEAVWTHIPWPPPIYAAEEVSHRIFGGWEGAEGIPQLSCQAVTRAKSGGYVNKSQ